MQDTALTALGTPTGSLIINLEAYEGPLEVLLELAKTQKVDLNQISILDLVEQYLEFVREAKRHDLDLAADYLVMASVLTYLKSRLLLPPPEVETVDLDPAVVAQALADRLRKLQAMKEAGEALMNLPTLGQLRFPSQQQPIASLSVRIAYTATLYDLLSAYAGFKQRSEASTLRVQSPKVMRFEDALQRLQKLLNVEMPTWTTLSAFLPDQGAGEEASPAMRRSTLASTLLASLELTRQGKIDLRQDSAFGPLYLRARSE